jgi:hypothetical protein
MPATATESSPTIANSAPLGRLWCVLETALVLAVFAAYAGWPVPDPNEAHYLGKAKHYYEPSWIVDDFFLDSADSHWAFYVTCGWLSRFLTLPTMAWIGRALTWLLLAISWRRLSWSLLPRWGAAVISAAIFVALNENFHMAGEWVVGGFEAKGFAYALVFAGLAELVRGRWNATWILLGAASAFHVLVGGWTVIAVGACWLVSGTRRPAVPSMLPGLIIGGLLSLPGLLPGVAINLGADPDVVARANVIYVYERLPHHLSFLGISDALVHRFLLLVGVWVMLAVAVPTDEGRHRLLKVVNASLIISAVGILLSIWGTYQPQLAAAWLRFYWFRLADVLVPLGVALWSVAFVAWWGVSRPAWRVAGAVALLAFAGWQLSPQIGARFDNPVPRADKKGKVENHADWRDACEWIDAHVPARARFLTPRTSQTFKWYAKRSEVATWKDLPQDAPGIVAWRERLEALYGTGDPEEPWFDSLAKTPRDRLLAAARKYDADYILTVAEPALDFPCLYRNTTYAVYELPGLRQPAP